MPLVPTYPSDEPDRDRKVPDLDDLAERILGRPGDPEPGPVVGAGG